MADKEDMKADDTPEKEDEVKKAEKKPEPKKKSKADKEDEILVKNTIEINPKLEEAKGGTVVMGWGRMNPITSGHEKLVSKIKDVARKEGATPVVYLTHSQDAKKNPLSYNDKVMLAKKAFGNMIQKSNAKTIMQAMAELEKKFTKVILVVGADRIKEFDALLNKYNGKDYNFDSIQVVSAGERTDPDSDDAKQMTADTMSASVMRKLASEGDFETFKKGLPKRLQRNAQDVYDMVRAGMKIAEELELDEAVLNFQQRRQRALTMRRYKSKLAAARKRLARRVSSKEKLQKKARKRAIALIRKKVAGEKGANYGDLNPAEKMMIDKRVAKRKGAIDRIAKRMLPQVRKADIKRVQGKRSTNEEFEMFLEATQVRQDPDIKDKKGTQPDVYYKGLSKSTKDKRDTHFKKYGKMDDDNPAAYKPAPGDAEAETKTSKHTKKYHKMYGEEVAEASKNDEMPKKRYHEARKKDGSIKLDKRFRAFKSSAVPQMESPLQDAQKRLKTQHQKERENLSREHETEMDNIKARGLAQQMRKLRSEENEQIMEWITDIADEIFESIELEEKKNDEGLKAKAEKSGMPLSILRKVYDRGVAAWRTGHRPGTTPQQWGFARVNSFITKSSGTWGKADSDLAAKVRKEEVEEAVSPAQQAAIAIAKKKKAGKPGYDSEGKSLKKEEEQGPCWAGYKQVGMKMKNGKEVPNCVPEETMPEDIDALFEKYMAHDPWRVKKAASVTVNRKMYNHALDALKKLLDRKKKEAGSAKNMRHGSNYYAAQIARSYDGVDARTLHNMLDEEYIIEVGGAGDRGTPKVTKRYKKDTPGESVNESLDDLFEAQFKVEVEGLPDMFIDAKSPGEVKATLRKKLKKPDDVKSIERVTPDKIKKHFRMVVRGDEDPTAVNEDVTQQQISDLEKFADRLLDKFDVDVEFTRHFADRMNDDRNNPKISIPELQRFFKKIAKNKAKDIKANANSEAVLNDIQADLNLPVVIKFNRDKEEFEVVNKTIMRKKNFKTPNKVIKY
jgi:hypothetical protein